MLASTCSMRFLSLATVKFLSRLLTALNLLPSIATGSSVTVCLDLAARAESEAWPWPRMSRNCHRLGLEKWYYLPWASHGNAAEADVEPLSSLRGFQSKSGGLTIWLTVPF